MQLTRLGLAARGDLYVETTRHRFPIIRAGRALRRTRGSVTELATGQAAYLALAVVGTIVFSRWLIGFLAEMPLRRHLRNGGQRVIIPAASTAAAHRASEQRRKNIIAALRSAEIELAPWIEGRVEGAPRRALPFEFLERPPDGREPPRRSLQNDPESGYAQMIRLAWQYGRDELLLAERAADIIIMASQSDSPSDERARDYPAVYVVRTEERSEGVFPWRVVVATADPARYERALSPLAEWLGVGVAVTAALPPVDLFGRCQGGGAGMSGLVGGSMRDSDSTFGVTCEHVLSRGCLSAVVRGRTSPGILPDAALVRETHCFEFPAPGTACSPASSEETESCMARRTVIRKRHRRATKALGLIYSRNVALPIGDGILRFPHLTIMRRPGGFLELIARPLRAWSFSRHGDSGSWVFETGRREWLGMIIGGERDFGGAFALEARPLVDFLAAAFATTPTGGGSTRAFGDFRTHEEER